MGTPQLFLVVGLMVCAASAVDESAAKGQPCFHIPNYVDFDWNWAAKVGTFYHPASSQLELYRMSKDILQVPYAKINQKEIDEDGCIKVKITADGIITTSGFGVAPYSYQTTRFIPKVYHMRPVLDARAYNGTLIIPFTDHSTYFITAICTADWEHTWGLHTTTPNPPNLNELIAKAESLGFNKKFTVVNKFAADCGKVTRRAEQLKRTEMHLPFNGPTANTFEGIKKDDLKTDILEEKDMKL